MGKPGRPILAGTVSILWLAVIISLYYVWHKPLNIETAFRIAKGIGQFVVSLGVLSVCGGLGRRLLRPEKAGLVWMAVQAGLGAGILSLTVLLVGTVIGIHPLFTWGGLVFLLAFLWRDALHWWRALGELKTIWLESTLFGRVLASLLFIIVLATLTTALAPPVKFDALVYHLALPHFYTLTRSIQYTPWLMFWGMPQTGEMLFTWAAALGGLEAAAALGWGVGMLAILGVVGYCYQRLGSATAWTGAIALLSGFTLSASLAWAYVEWLLILFGFGVLVCLDAYRSNPAPRYLILAGVFAGFSLGSKYTGGVMLLVGLAWLLWQARNQKPGARKIVTQYSLFTLVAVGVSLPWWIKNIIATGSPFYPFFLPAGAMDAFRIGFYQLEPWGNWLEALFLPVYASLTGVEGAPGYSASIGPLLLGFGVCAVWYIRSQPGDERAAVGSAAVISLTGIVIWMAASRLSGYLIQSRLFVSLFPAFAFLAAAGYKSVSAIRLPGVRFGRLANVLLLLVFTLNSLEVGRHTFGMGSAQVLLAITPPQQYLEDNLGWYARAMQAVNQLPAEAKVLMLWEPRSLYCLPKCEPDEILDRWKHERALWEQPERIRDSWLSQGYTHLLYYDLGADFVRHEDKRYTEADWLTLDEMLRRLSPPVDFGSAYTLYRLKP